jgi:hypothetical protein
MWHQKSKLDRANVISAFENQDEAEEAILALRMDGYRDRQIGYYFSDGHGEMEDQLARYHRFAGAVVGSFIGAVIGWAFARSVFFLGNDLDQFGLAIISAITGASLFGTLGGFSGLWLKPPQDEASVPNGFAEPYVITVEAGDSWQRAWSMIRQHGGHELPTVPTDLPPRPSTTRMIPVVEKKWETSPV